MWLCSNSDNNNLIAITKYLILTHCLANWNGTLLTMCLGISLIKRTEPWKRQVLQTQQFFYMCRLIPTLSIGQWYWAQQGWNQDVKEFHFCQCRWKLNFQHFFSTKTTVAFDWTQKWDFVTKICSTKWEKEVVLEKRRRLATCLSHIFPHEWNLWIMTKCTKYHSFVSTLARMWGACFMALLSM